MTPPPTPDQARRMIIQSMRIGREYTFNDIKNRTGLDKAQILRNMVRLHKMGVIDTPELVQELTVYRLAKTERATA